MRISGRTLLVSLLVTQLLAAAIPLAQGAALKSDQQEVGNSAVRACGTALSSEKCQGIAFRHLGACSITRVPMLTTRGRPLGHVSVQLCLPTDGSMGHVSWQGLQNRLHVSRRIARRQWPIMANGHGWTMC